jgi:malonate decarboxylase beta subunit
MGRGLCDWPGGTVAPAAAPAPHRAGNEAPGQRLSIPPRAGITACVREPLPLQEAHLALNAVSEICAAVLELWPFAPVIGVVAGETGCFGDNGIVAGLCTHLIVTPHGRIGLNGPAVIEEEAGRAESKSRILY